MKSRPLVSGPWPPGYRALERDPGETEVPVALLNRSDVPAQLHCVLLTQFFRLGQAELRHVLADDDPEVIEDAQDVEVRGRGVWGPGQVLELEGRKVRLALRRADNDRRHHVGDPIAIHEALLGHALIILVFLHVPESRLDDLLHLFRCEGRREAEGELACRLFDYISFHDTVDGVEHGPTPSLGRGPLVRRKLRRQLGHGHVMVEAMASMWP